MRPAWEGKPAVGDEDDVAGAHHGGGSLEADRFPLRSFVHVSDFDGAGPSNDEGETTFAAVAEPTLCWKEGTEKTHLYFSCRLTFYFYLFKFS